MSIRIDRLLSLVLAISMLLVLVPAVAATPPAQAKGQDYVVVKDDWLSKLADKYLGNMLSYPAIVALTNDKTAKDSSYAKIDNPDRIEVGWKLYIPSAEEATAYMATYKPAQETAVKTPEAGTGGVRFVIWVTTNEFEGKMQILDELKADFEKESGHKVDLILLSQR
jgi:hypothetical protein